MGNSRNVCYKTRRKWLFFVVFLSFFFRGSEFYMRSGALHYISAVLTLHAKRIVYGALTKDEGEDKKKIKMSSPLKLSAWDRFKVIWERGSRRWIFLGLQMGRDGFVVLEDRALMGRGLPQLRGARRSKRGIK